MIQISKNIPTYHQQPFQTSNTIGRQSFVCENFHIYRRNTKLENTKHKTQNTRTVLRLFIFTVLFLGTISHHKVSKWSKTKFLGFRQNPNPFMCTVFSCISKY